MPSICLLVKSVFTNGNRPLREVRDDAQDVFGDIVLQGMKQKHTSSKVHWKARGVCIFLGQSERRSRGHGSTHLKASKFLSVGKHDASGRAFWKWKHLNDVKITFSNGDRNISQGVKEAIDLNMDLLQKRISLPQACAVCPCSPLRSRRLFDSADAKR